MQLAEPSGTETTGMNELEVEVHPSRRLQRADPVSKHAKGRQKPLSKKEKARNKVRRIRESRALAMDRKAIERAFNGG